MYASNYVTRRRVAIACQGGAVHTAFTAGALQRVLEDYEQHDESVYTIMGLSGTSGGTICAALVWYHLITSGPAQARKALGEFWGQGNSPGSLLEQLINDWGLQLLRSLPVASKLSPYELDVQLIMDSWSLLYAGAGPFGALVAPRPEFINLQTLLERYIDFATVERIGAIQRHLDQAGRIITATYTLPQLEIVQQLPGRLQQIAKMLDTVDLEIRRPSVPQGDGKLWIRPDIRACWEEAHGAIGDLIGPLMEPQPSTSLNITKVIEGLKEIKGKLANLPIPTLLLGAVDVLSGKFKAFDSRKAEISRESVIASTVLPELFRARQIGNQHFWDGLFSENSPLLGFVDYPDDPGEKPDELWVIKIDPLDSQRLPNSGRKIEDRRNELAGDLSLQQEITAIETMNQLLSKFEVNSRSKYKHIDVMRIQLDSERVWPQVGSLDYASKVYRGDRYIAALMSHGRDQVTTFLPVASHKALARRFVEQVLNGLLDLPPKGNDKLVDLIIDELVASGHILHDSQDLPAEPGGKGIRKFVAALQSYYQHPDKPTDSEPERPRIHITIDDLIGEGEYVVLRWTARGSRQDAPGYLKLMGTWISRLDRGTIAESWVWDTRAIQVQARPVMPCSPIPTTRLLDLKTKEIVQSWLSKDWQRTNPADIEQAINSYFATDYIHNDAGYYPPVCDRTDYRAWFVTNGPSLPQLKVEGHLIVEGDRVVARLSWTAPKLGQDQQRSGVVIYRVAGGVIQESWWTWDTTTMLL